MLEPVTDHPWWVDRWIDLLQSYRFKKRLERGWNYARGGHVQSIEFQGAEVIAKVQGTEPKPYRVAISLESFTEEDWQYIVTTLATKARYSAQLLAGEMPPDIEQVFAVNGLSLFPFQLAEVNSACTCPDPQNPCKHIAAVYYLLGDRFREDPFVLFQLRGQTRYQILAALRHQSLEPAHPDLETVPLTSPELFPEPLPVADFWDYDVELDLGSIATPTTTIWQVLPPLPLNKPVADQVKNYFQQVYRLVQTKVMAENAEGRSISD